jgi:hypothetical protein
MTNDEEVVTMLKDLNNKIDRLTRALTDHWKDEAARRREGTWK